MSCFYACPGEAGCGPDDGCHQEGLGLLGQGQAVRFMEQIHSPSSPKLILKQFWYHRTTIYFVSSLHRHYYSENKYFWTSASCRPLLSIISFVHKIKNGNHVYIDSGKFILAAWSRRCNYSTTSSSSSSGGYMFAFIGLQVSFSFLFSSNEWGFVNECLGKYMENWEAPWTSQWKSLG